MPEARSTGTEILRTLTVDAVVIVGVVLLLAVPATAVARPNPVPRALPRLLSGVSGVTLSVDPPSYWMRSGGNVTLQAVWTTGSPLCSISPLWYSWEVRGGNATGLLNETSGPVVTFVAETFVSGSVVAAVRSEAIVACGANQTVLERAGSASLSVVVPLAVTGVSLSSYLPSPGRNVTLEGHVMGGAPPYELEIGWGDGTETGISLPSAGNFTARHAFPSGGFAPSILAHDTEGDLANVSVPEVVSVGSGFRVAIVPAHYVVAVGTPVEFSGVVAAAPSGSVVLFDCSNASQGLANSSSADPNITSFSCTFHSPGTAEVLFGSYPPYPGGPTASAVLYETVVGPPQVRVVPGSAQGEVGGSVPVPIDLSGGALPILLAWNLTGNRSSGTEVVDADGSGVLTLPLSLPGAYSLGIRAADALGQFDTNGTLRVEVDPALKASADGASSIIPSGALAQVSGGVVAGCPPFSWWIVPAMTTSNATADEGTIAVAGGFTWNGTYLREGNLSVTLVVADACGVSWQTAFVEPLIPTMSSRISVEAGPPSSNETIAVNVSVRGGWAPFRLWVNASDGGAWNGTVLLDGPTSWLFRTSGNGTVTVRVAVTDALGDRVDFADSIFLQPPAPTPSPPPSSSNVSVPLGGSPGPSTTDVASLFLAFLLPVGVAIAGGLAWRHRVRKKTKAQGSENDPGPDPEATLRRIIEPAEGAERFTVEMLATEAGVPLAIVRSTIDRLVSERKVCSETGADGEEVLSWSEERR